MEEEIRRNTKFGKIEKYTEIFRGLWGNSFFVFSE